MRLEIIRQMEEQLHLEDISGFPLNRHLVRFLEKSAKNSSDKFRSRKIAGAFRVRDPGDDDEIGIVLGVTSRDSDVMNRRMLRELVLLEGKRRRYRDFVIFI